MSDLRRLRPIRRGTIVTIHPLEGAGRRERIRVNGIVTSTTGLQWYAGQSVLDGTGRLFQPEDIVRRNPNYADVLQARRELQEKLRGTPLMYSVALERWLGDDEDREDLVISAVNQMLREGWQKAALDRSHALVIARHGTTKPYYSVLLERSARSNPVRHFSAPEQYKSVKRAFKHLPASAYNRAVAAYNDSDWMRLASLVATRDVYDAFDGGGGYNLVIANLSGYLKRNATRTGKWLSERHA